MKTKLTFVPALLVSFILHSSLCNLEAQGTAFTYQGRLQNNGSPATGVCDLTFTLYSASNSGPALAGPLTNLSVPLSNGLFTVSMDFGDGVFTGNAVWLEVAARPSGNGSFTTLSPRQSITPSPYSIYAGEAGSVTGPIALGQLPSAVVTNNATNETLTGNFFGNFGGSFFGSGSGLVGVMPANLGPGTAAINISGNAATATTAASAGSYTGPIADGQLSTNIPRLNGTNFFASSNLFSGGVVATNSSNLFGGAFSGVVSGNGNGLSNLNISQFSSPIVTNAASNVTLGGSFAGSFNGNGSGLSNVNALTVNGLNATNFWQLGGNMVSPGQFVGSTNNQPVEMWVNNQRALRLEPGSNGAPNLIGGSSVNLVSNGIYGASIGGGGVTNYLGFGVGFTNIVGGNFGTVGGGFQNSANGSNSTIGGGLFNTASNYATVAGGSAGSAYGAYSTIGGGNQNFAGASNATVGGGSYNHATNLDSTVSGGTSGQAGGQYSTVPGGYVNLAAGDYSFAAGNQAQALHTGAFVWSDAQNATFASTTSNQFNVRAGGGVRFVTSGSGMTIDQLPVLTTSNAAEGLVLQTNSSGAPNVIEGSSENIVSNGVLGATISGGGSTNYAGIIYTNIVGGNFGTVGGGGGNVAAGIYSTVGGGLLNTAAGFGDTIAGGGDNLASNSYDFIGGGSINKAIGSFDVVGGGNNNLASNNYSTIDGGTGNIALGQYSIVTGGYQNLASGDYTFAAGNQAQATNIGSFVWADNQGLAFNSTSNNQFNIRAGGGARFVTGGVGMTLDGNPVLASGSGLGITIQQNSSGAPNVILGSTVNGVGNGVIGATIGGGGAVNVSGASYSNIVTASFGTVGGGAQNWAQNSYTTIGGGFSNSIIGQYGTVAGGQQNFVSGLRAFVGGGWLNTASASEATVVAGYGNTASGPGSFIGGGGTSGSPLAGNTASGAASVIGGGLGNSATAAGAVVVGGGTDGSVNLPNVAGTVAATVGGGLGNTNTSLYGTIAGGRNNTILNSYATIGGGLSNNVIGTDGVIAGGQQNSASGLRSTVAGGWLNSASQTEATVGGGYSNSATGPGAFAGGGGFDGSLLAGNTAGGAASVIAGGIGNTNGGTYGTIGGGISNNCSGTGSTIAGGSNNIAFGNCITIAGGQGNYSTGPDATIAGGIINTANGFYSSIVGGYNNNASGPGAFIGGGGYDGTSLFGNTASGGASVLGGGFDNNVSGQYATIAGGRVNTAGGQYGAVAGGYENNATGLASAIGGGYINEIESGSSYSTIPGGYENLINASNAFAAGSQAQAVNNGTFVWADSAGGAFTSTGINQFLVRAGGGVGINTNSPAGAALNVNGSVIMAPGNGTLSFINDSGIVPGITATGGNAPGHARFRNALEIWPNAAGTASGYLDIRYTNGVPQITLDGSTGNVSFSNVTCGNILCANINAAEVTAASYNVSDRKAKEHFAPVDARQVLDKVDTLPITEWNYKRGDTSRHIGPMAQDFKAAFNLGIDDKRIATVDEGGVALAAIQGLNKKLESELKTRDAEIADLKTRLDKLERMMSRQLADR